MPKSTTSSIVCRRSRGKRPKQHENNGHSKSYGNQPFGSQAQIHSSFVSLSPLISFSILAAKVAELITGSGQDLDDGAHTKQKTATRREQGRQSGSADGDRHPLPDVRQARLGGRVWRAVPDLQQED